MHDIFSKENIGVSVKVNMVTVDITTDILLELLEKSFFGYIQAELRPCFDVRLSDEGGGGRNGEKEKQGAEKA